ncbi:sugar phosphate isomerase/epimerase [Paenibacillus wynnii]|uniref:sugar phosphate isomerase/epimerase n=1 Tax=Paenibacillus wynnii TaxID=268407 RepID=UPI002791DEFE|nr:sugar phosphate isomerase/epimerase [Paenibacillus wynnii]MDQ0192319.1 sugar phosphate isomerase/epimerase [Paenibacillus wynnii]
MVQVFTTTASLGPLAVQQGQEFCIPVAKAAGCAGIEIRRELFQENPCLSALDQQIKSERLVSVYSAPVELWNVDGTLNVESLDIIIPEALAIGAIWIKTSLGHYLPGTSDLTGLEHYWANRVPVESALKLTVENDQTPHGGNVRKLQRFFEDCHQAGLRICMTFDVGNWHWTGEEGLQAAAALAGNVGYIHLKHVETVNGKLVTLGLPEEANSLWRNILALLPQDVPRTIEFPVEGEDLTQALQQYVAMIAEA